MKVYERTITTLELTDVEEVALNIAHQLLNEVEANLFKNSDIIMNADTGEIVERGNLAITRNLLDTLLNDRCPTRWELHG